MGEAEMPAGFLAQAVGYIKCFSEMITPGGGKSKFEETV